MGQHSNPGTCKTASPRQSASGTSKTNATGRERSSGASVEHQQCWAVPGGAQAGGKGPAKPEALLPDQVLPLVLVLLLLRVQRHEAMRRY